MPTKPRRAVLTPGIFLLVIALAAAGYLLLRQHKPLLIGSGCQAGRGAAAVALDPEQAAIAATIAGVAHRRSMPLHAVTIEMGCMQFIPGSHQHGVYDHVFYDGDAAHNLLEAVGVTQDDARLGVEGGLQAHRARLGRR